MGIWNAVKVVCGGGFLIISLLTFSLQTMAQSISNLDVVFYELCRTGTVTQVKEALAQGANPKTENSFGGTALRVAAMSNPNPEVITTLLEAGANLNDRTKDGWGGNDWTVLMYAAMSNPNPEVITTLLKSGAKIDDGAEDSWGNSRTALMIAAQNNPNPEIITTLLKGGAKIEARNKHGVTALMLAARENPNPEVIITLLNAGANAKARDKDGKTAFDYAEKNDKLRGTETYWALNDARY